MAIFAASCDPLACPEFIAALRIAKNSGCKLILVGGYIRDALAKRITNTGQRDFDFMVLGGPARSLAKEVAEALSGHYVLLDDNTDTARVVLANGDMMDFAACVGGTIESDLTRRDFTINAFAIDPEQPDKLIDIFSGQEDLKSRKIKAISKQAFLEDPLRMLRAFRFAALFDFNIDQNTLSTIALYAAHLSSVASERISYEFFLTLESCFAGKNIKLAAENGLLEVMFPELTPTREVTPNAFHHLRLFEHSIETLIQVEDAYQHMPSWAQETLNSFVSSKVSQLAATKAAGLLHDIGKPDTWEIRPDGRHTFIGHDKLGAQMCQILALRLKWSKPLDNFIEKLVRWHLRPAHLFNQGIQPSEKAIYRFYRTISQEVPGLILLALGDLRSTCGAGLKDKKEQMERELFELLNSYNVYLDRQRNNPCLLNGNEVMQILRIQAGPVVGRLLADLIEAQNLKEISGKQAAIEFIQNRYQQKYSR